MKDQTVINNLLVNYYNFKSDGKKTIIFLHGWRSDSLAWSQIFKNLSNEAINIYAIDLPGFGGSAVPKEALSIQDYADVVAEFIRKLSLKNIILVGHSFGGRISIKLAAMHPELINALILVDSAGIRLNTEKSDAMGKLAKIVKPIFKPRFMAGPRKLIYKAIGSDDYLATPELQQIYLKATGEDLRKHFKDIDKPTMLLWGAKDKDTPLEIADIMNKEIKNSKLVVFENAGHFSFIDQPEKFTKELVKFIKSN